MTDSIIKCPRCQSTHHIAQHNLTASGDRSPVCMHCDGGPKVTLPPDALVPPMRRSVRSGSFVFAPDRALRAVRSLLFSRGGAAD